MPPSLLQQFSVATVLFPPYRYFAHLLLLPPSLRACVLPTCRAAMSLPRNGAAQSPPLILLVIQADKYDWADIVQQALAQASTAARPTRDVRVLQTSWEHLQVGPCSNEPLLAPDKRQRIIRFGTVQVQVSAMFKNGDKQELSSSLTITPDFVLVRNECVAPHFSYRHSLLGLLYANVPAVNSLRTILLNCDRPVMTSALNRIRSVKFRDRPAAFPIIPQDFYPSANGFFYGHRFPAVVKFGSAHAGLAKLRVADHHDMRDVAGLLSSTKEGYVTAEPFVDAEYDLRIQRIGGCIRAYERRSVSGAWKTNTGGSEVVEVTVTDEFRQWAEAAAVMFGESEDDRMDILSVDAIVSKPHPRTGERSTYILEVNGTSPGLMAEREDEDNLLIAALVLEKLRKVYNT